MVDKFILLGICVFSYNQESVIQVCRYIRYGYSLGNFEGERKVVSAFLRRELGVVEGVRQEVVHQRAERQPVRPTRGEVLQLHILDKHITCYTTLMLGKEFGKWHFHESLWLHLLFQNKNRKRTAKSF